MQSMSKNYPSRATDSPSPIRRYVSFFRNDLAILAFRFPNWFNKTVSFTWFLLGLNWSGIKSKHYFVKIFLSFLSLSCKLVSAPPLYMENKQTNINDSSCLLPWYTFSLWNIHLRNSRKLNTLLREEDVLFILHQCVGYMNCVVKEVGDWLRNFVPQIYLSHKC